MKIETDPKLDFSSVLIRPKRSTLSSRNQINLERTFTFPYSDKIWTGIPIIAANMDTTGTFDVYNVLSQHKMLTSMNKHYTISDYETFGLENLDPDYYMISTGISNNDFEKLQQIIQYTGCNWICIDVANGYQANLISFCQRVRETFPNKIIIAGNVVSREITEELIINGQVDIVKVGIGPGSVCTTRLKTGVGLPQLSAIIETSDAAHGLNGYIIGDGGITSPGDMAKAFGGGADFVMAGGIFAGHDENPGELVNETDSSGVLKQYKLFYGMSSAHAMEKHSGGVAKYRASEGKVVKVLYRGPLENTILDYLGGLRSTCTYINANCIKHMPKCTTFVLVSNQLNNIFS